PGADPRRPVRRYEADRLERRVPRPESQARRRLECEAQVGRDPRRERLQAPAPGGLERPAPVLESALERKLQGLGAAGERGAEPLAGLAGGEFGGQAVELDAGEPERLGV